MSTLMQALVIAVLAVIGLRLPKGTTRSRLFSGLKAWFTVLCFWALLTHPMQNEAGETVIALELIRETIGKIELKAACRPSLLRASGAASDCRNARYEASCVSSRNGTCSTLVRLPKLLRMRFFSVKV